MLIEWGSKHIESTAENVNMVRPKFAQTLVLFFVEEFPSGWPNFFDELIQLLPRHPMHVDMFLRILDTIDEMVVSTEFPRTAFEIERNTRLKDALREGPMGSIVTAWFNVLSSCVQSQPQLVSLTLTVMKKYAPWIDIQFFTRPEFMRMMASFLASEKLQKEAAKCIAAITGKGMPPIDKLELIRRFNLLQMCREARPQRNTRFAVYMARWINELGRHILDGLAALRNQNSDANAIRQAVDMLDTSVPLMLSCLKELHLDAAIEVIDFATRYVNYVKAAPAEWIRASDTNALQEMLQSIAKLLMFPADTQLPSTLISGETDDECEELEDWLDQRERLAHVFRAIGRLQTQLCSSFVSSMAQAVLPRHASLPWNNVELVMYLMLCLGEVLIQDGASALKNQFRPFLALTLQSDVAGNAHFMVVKATFEVMVRFFRYIPSDEASLLLIIQVTESRGIRHAHPAVRKRAMFNFNRLAQKFGHSLVPVLPRLLQSLHGMLQPISQRAQDGGYFFFQMTLYETLGLLIGQNPDDSAQPTQVEMILGPVAAELRRLAAAPSAGALQMTQLQMCFTAARAVDAASSFSKGFSGIVSRENRTKEVFVGVFQTVMVLRRKQLGDEELQQKCLQFMHRMVEVLQHEFLQSLEPIVQMLLMEGGTTGAQDFMKLMGQLISRFGLQMQQFLGAILAPLTTKVFDYVASGERELARQAQAGAGAAVALSELGREVRVLRTSYYGFLMVLCRNRELADVLLRPENRAVLEATLTALKQGVLWWGQPREQRDVWSILVMLLEAWGPSPDHGFQSWFVRELLPILLRSPFSDSFAFDQGAHVALVRMLCQVQYVCLTTLGDDFKRALLQTLKEVGCNDQIQQQYITMLTGSDKEAFIDFYSGILRKWRKARIAHNKR